MPVSCLFCDCNSGSREHLWPAWIHERKDFGPLRHRIGSAPVKILNDPELKVKTVCGKCNNGWMSDLEGENIPLIGCMFQDISTPLDEAQQHSVSAWAVKTAMMMDSVKGRKSGVRFYEKAECTHMRVSRAIPDGARIWIGRSAVSSLGAYGTDLAIITPEGTPIGAGAATTIVVGHLAVQVLAMRTNPEFQGKPITDVHPKPDDWDNMLVSIWPVGPHKVIWPPKVTFTRTGPTSIAILMDRWRIGQAVETILPM